jgi:hypothetical protein
MNTNTGWTGKLPEGLEVDLGTDLRNLTEEVERHAQREREPEKHKELVEALKKKEPIVAVSAEVVQRLRLGDRELRRRKQRRR